MSATARDASGDILTGRSIQWSSDKDAVATVSGSGATATVSAKTVGIATITATSEGKTGTLTVAVVAAPVHSLSITPDTVTLGLAGTRQLSAIVRDAAGNALTGRQVAWTTSDSSKVRVSTSGNVTAVSAGTATITAQSEGKTDTATVTVSAFVSGERVLSPGVVHRYRWDPAGPWAVHVVEANLRSCGVDLRTAKANDQLIGRARTTTMAAQVGRNTSRPVLAAINGDFFSPLGIPQSAQVIDGDIVKGSPDLPAFGVTATETPFIGKHPLAGELRTRSGDSRAMRGVNERPDSQGVALYNRFFGQSTPTDTGVVEVLATPLSDPAAVGETVKGVVASVDTTAAGVAIPNTSVVLAGRAQTGSFLRTSIAAGDTITWVHRFSEAPGPVAELIGGNFQLVRGGQDVIGEAADRERHPRTGVGLRSDGTLLLVTVDGRQPGYSVGMSQPEMIQLFQGLGAVDVLNLDGGGSTTMVIEGALANRPSDPAGERPVANAVVVLGGTPGTCP